MTKRNIIIISIIALSAIWSVAFVSEPVLAQNTCGGADTSIISCEGEGQDAIFNVIKIIIQIMTVSIGVVAVGAVIFGALLYGMSGDNPENVKKAKGIWMNVVIGLLLFAFLVAITNFLIPGGVF